MIVTTCFAFEMSCFEGHNDTRDEEGAGRLWVPRSARLSCLHPFGYLAHCYDIAAARVDHGTTRTG